jgi:hypothetical protein
MKKGEQWQWKTSKIMNRFTGAQAHKHMDEELFSGWKEVRKE